MGALEITLIAVGLVIIAASYYISEKGASSAETVKELETIADYEERKRLEKDTKHKLDHLAEEVYASANASLCKLSNEKIMAVNEYGDMVMERIDKSHSEVVFLYSMLTDKEKELKELILMHYGNNKEDVSAKPEEMEEKMIESQADTILNLRTVPEEEEGEPNELHKQILSLYRNGKSVREISKELDLGQGEVRLVVNVYTGGN